MARPLPFGLRRLFVLAGIVGIAACAPNQSQQHPDSVTLGSVTKTIAYGENTISGSASLVSRSGYVRTCEGNAVYLMPVTAASTGLMVDLFGNPSGGIGQRFKFEHQPDDILTSGKQVECQKKGIFKFEHIADGSYYVVTDVTWLLRWAHEGAALGQVIQIDGGRAINVELRHEY